MNTVGKPPRRWAAVHKEMQTCFSGLRFTGDVEPMKDGNGETYFKIENLEVECDLEGAKRTKQQFGNKPETIGEQIWNN